jgi:hypothetical protein
MDSYPRRAKAGDQSGAHSVIAYRPKKSGNATHRSKRPGRVRGGATGSEAQATGYIGGVLDVAFRMNCYIEHQVA